MAITQKWKSDFDTRIHLPAELKLKLPANKSVGLYYLRISEGHRIGILDLSGFENMAVNSFEQLCINVANEKLQYYFNEHIFLIEQAQYEAEGISWRHIQFQNNERLLELCLGPQMGGSGAGQGRYASTLFGLLDDQCRFPQTNARTLLDKWDETFKGDANFAVHGRFEPSFTITHYADQVRASLRYKHIQLHSITVQVRNRSEVLFQPAKQIREFSSAIRIKRS